MNDLAIGTHCDKCGCTTSITELFSYEPKKYYYCKCNHPANRNIFTKLLWILNGSPAMEIENEENN